MTTEEEQMKLELLACLQEQFYSGKLNYAGLVLIGLWELEGKFVEKIIKGEGK
jgi:hypothetical protein